MLSRPMTFPPRHVALHLAAWLGMLVLAVLNGALREALLTPALGGTVGRQLSTLLLLALFAGWFWFLHRRWPLATARQAWLVRRRVVDHDACLRNFYGARPRGQAMVGGLRGLRRARGSDLDPGAAVDLGRAVRPLPRLDRKAAKQWEKWEIHRGVPPTPVTMFFASLGERSEVAGTHRGETPLFHF